MKNINPDTFCPSLWYHMRILPNGHMRFCRWGGIGKTANEDSMTSSLTQDNFLEFFQNEMSTLRMDMIKGKKIPACQECQLMELHGKVSGRERQLLKVGIKRNNFDKTFRSSPFYKEFQKSAENNGHTNLWPQDWQIDLGNQCNSNCIFCTPEYSSKLGAELIKLGIVDYKKPTTSWSNDDAAVERFVDMLKKTKSIAYLHFVGGEPFVIPGFKNILQKLVDQGLHKTVSLGFTTNLTRWDEAIVDLLKQYQEVNLGVSLECFDQINDYLRYPSKIEQVEDTLEKFLQVSKNKNWLTCLRITPTVFSVPHLVSVYEYAYNKNIGVESCNFLDEPVCMRMNILPKTMRQEFADKLQTWIDSKNLPLGERTLNFRDPNIVHKGILEDAQSYVNYIRNAPEETHRLPDTVSYIKKLETLRVNTILDYVSPEYRKLLRSAGY